MGVKTEMVKTYHNVDDLKQALQAAWADLDAKVISGPCKDVKILQKEVGYCGDGQRWPFLITP